MREGKSVEIICPACGAEALLVRRPVYDGLAKTGEILSCAACGHEFASEAEVPFKDKEQVRVFSEADKSKPVQVFEENEAEHICRHCARYVLNPFMQWCSFHKKEVEATDTCEHFEPRRDKTEPGF
ncbi:MAG: hypothetical protein JXB04_06050 [Kiritimatiellae bacterium]|nr:hypothetical protein [Kiritimatiellia bacterium]